MPIITEAGFHADIPRAFIPFAAAGADAIAVDTPNDARAEEIAARLTGAEIIRIPFPSAADGRGFSLARRLRDLGYTGRLRAQGHVISDQFDYALSCGFDEIEIDDALAARQPAAQWRKDPVRMGGYRDKLRAGRSFPAPAGVHEERVTEVEHYTDRLFRFRVTRPASLRFRSGEFAMIGLPNAERPVFRAYSIASPSWDETLEFYSIKVPGGPLTSRLRRIRPGDPILLRRKTTGTLVADALTAGERLYLFATGTGVAPFASLIRDPEVYDKFGQVILCHTTRSRAELTYGVEVVAAAKADPLVGERAAAQLVSWRSTTRDAAPGGGRVTDAIRDGRLFRALGAPELSPATDRAMICGSSAMLAETARLCAAHGLSEGAVSRPGAFCYEKAFVGDGGV